MVTNKINDDEDNHEIYCGDPPGIRIAPTTVRGANANHRIGTILIFDHFQKAAGCKWSTTKTKVCNQEKPMPQHMNYRPTARIRKVCQKTVAGI